MTEQFSIRPAGAQDAEFLRLMLIESVNWLPERNWSPERVMADPSTAHYVADWPRPGDSGVVAVDSPGAPVGAAWLRLFTSADPGYGFVADDVPELTVAVSSDWRGKGVGRALLQAIHRQASAAGLGVLSLSVERANPAHRLYRSMGYQVRESGRDSDTMVIDLTDGLRGR